MRLEHLTNDDRDPCDLARDRRQREEEERMISVGAKIKQIAGLAGTKDVDQRTSDFIDSVVISTNAGTKTSHLSDKQIDWIEDIHRKHFGEQ